MKKLNELSLKMKKELFGKNNVNTVLLINDKGEFWGIEEEFLKAQLTHQNLVMLVYKQAIIDKFIIMDNDEYVETIEEFILEFNKINKFWNLEEVV